MEIMEIIEQRHSVRKYNTKPIEDKKRHVIDRMVEEINADADLNIQVFYDEPKCFKSFLAKYGHFKNANNYISIVGKKSDTLDERAGYFGEKLVLSLKEMEIDSCWVALTHGKSKAVIGKGEKEVIIISFGYADNHGVPHKSKSMADCCNYSTNLPSWFIEGMKAVMLAPTALNQQKFFFRCDEEYVTATTKPGSYTQVDLGIAKFHFEVVSLHKVE